MAHSPRPDAAPAAGAVAPAFRWGDVAAADRDWLRRRTGDLHALVYRSACDLVRMGLVLAEVRAKLPWGAYGAWLGAETPYSRATAYRLMAAGAAFEPYLSQIETIEPCALYLLAQPAVPASARAYAVELAGDGEPVTHAAARQILDAHRPTPDPGRAEMRAHDATMRGIRSAEKGERAEAERPPDPERLAGHWAALEKLAAECSVVHVSLLEDADGDDAPAYSVSLHWRDRPPGAPDERPRNVVRRRLADAIRAAAGMEEEKYCPGCRATKKAGEFGECGDQPDGRNPRCKVCERARRKSNRKRPKKGRPGPGAPPGA